MISAECPSCGAIQEMPAEAAGCIGTCTCGQRFRIPGKAQEPLGLGGVSKAGCGPMVVEAGAVICTGGLAGGLGRLIAGKGSASLFLSLSLGITLWALVFLMGGWLWVLVPILWGLFVVGKLIVDFIACAA